MKICHSIVLALLPLVPIPSLAQTPVHQPTEKFPTQSVNYQICTLMVSPQTGEATSVCSPVNKCTSNQKLGKLSTDHVLEEMDSNQFNLTSVHAIRIAM
jgi:hypothetical protein